jgi:hypothetical protein
VLFEIVGHVVSFFASYRGCCDAPVRHCAP